MSFAKLCAGVGAAAVTLAAFGQPSLAERPRPTDAVRIAAVRMQLVYENSGRLSRDITPPSNFALWNTGAGEGDAAEPANQAMVSVVLAGRGMERLQHTPLHLTVRGPQGRVLVSRTFNDVFMTGGRVVRSVMVQNIACAGRVTIEARLGAQRRTSAVNFECGE